MRRYLILRFSAIVITTIYLGIRKESPPTWLSEFLLYNLIPLFCVITILLSPKFHDRRARLSVAGAIALWGFGSLLSTWNSFSSFQVWERAIDLGYVAFYPFMILGLSSALRISQSSSRLEFVDSIIIALGLTSVIGVLFLKPASFTFSGSGFDIFLAIFYPIGDLILLGLVLSLSIIQKRSLHNALLAFGLVVFTISDIYFLWASAAGSYNFGDLTDIGWPLSFILVAESFWHRGEEARENLRLNPVLATFALLLSATVMVISALRPGYFPSLALLPAFATVALAFIRMTLAISEAKAMSAERILARTDELTGLANRRRFISELEKVSDNRSSVLLLDLNGFKEVNDRFGHDAGDELLKRVALRFTRIIPHSSLLARLGGDEFGVIVRESDSFEIAQALRATLTYPFEIGGQPIQLDVSIGEAQIDGTGQVLRRADEAMYQAKRAGGGVVRWHRSGDFSLGLGGDKFHLPADRRFEQQGEGH